MFEKVFLKTALNFNMVSLLYVIRSGTKASTVQSLSRVRFFETPWTATCQASLSMANFLSLLKLMSIESVMPSNHLILCRPLLLLHSIFPSIRDFSYESTLQFRWTKGWSFRFSISPSSDYSGLISSRMDCLQSPYSPRDSKQFSPNEFKSINSLNTAKFVLLHG